VKKAELEDILLSFYNKEEEEAKAKSAFVKFYKEFSKYLLVVISNAKRPWAALDDQIIETVLDDTFLKIYNKPPLSFRFEVEDSDSDVTTRFKSYLATTAKRIFIDKAKGLFNTQEKFKLENLNGEQDELMNFELPKFNSSPEIELSEHRRLLEEVLLTFKERDKHILLTIYQYEQEGKKRPKEAMKELAKIHGTSSANIRKIKQRREADIVNHFQKHSGLKPKQEIIGVVRIKK